MEGRLLKNVLIGLPPFGTTISMTYTADGMRKSKTLNSGFNSTTNEYIYNGSSLVQEKVTNIYSGNITTDQLTYLYNGEGLTGFVRNGTLYTYRRNLFGDIIAIYQG